MKKIFFIAFILFLMCGCQSKGKEPLLFTGKSDNWIVKETVKPISDKDKGEPKTIKLTYTGKDKKSVGEFSFKLEAPNGQWGVSIIELDKEGKFEEKTNAIVNRETLKSDKPIIILKWNDQKEEITLKNKNQP
ncbi:hypothetical protein FA002_24005 [Priestia megaterium]|uniref:membrane lipoprotein lipid attachment site-containing protein n=1 Tax=Priestia megaterium TaxID=1404 RepID=UPI0010AC8C96|nr:membrane lipoprotein lipid attachment site-containing protein [Priestia megaterium]TJZ32243.1 hypothetical protein FA002_24005 [Priestia megaterium]